MLDKIKKDWIKLSNDIEETNSLIRKLEEKRRILWDKQSWTEMFVRPIMDRVVERYPNIDWGDLKYFSPMGLDSIVTEFGKDPKSGRCVVLLQFYPQHLEKGEISLLDINYIGDTSKNKTIDSIDVVFNHIEKQLNEKINSKIPQTVIHGVSDDLIEVDGEVVKEIDCYNKTKHRFTCSDGTMGIINYDHSGDWKIEVTRKGDKYIGHVPSNIPNQFDSKFGRRIYSDMVMFDNGIEFVKFAKIK